MVTFTFLLTPRAGATVLRCVPTIDQSMLSAHRAYRNFNAPSQPSRCLRTRMRASGGRACWCSRVPSLAYPGLRFHLATAAVQNGLGVAVGLGSPFQVETVQEIFYLTAAEIPAVLIADILHLELFAMMGLVDDDADHQVLPK